MAPIAEFEKMMVNSSPDQMKAGTDEWMKWMKNHEKDIVDMGSPLGKTKRSMTSGVTDVKTDVGGYSVVQAESHDDAVKIFADNPHFKIPGAYIDILEVMEIPGM